MGKQVLRAAAILGVAFAFGVGVTSVSFANNGEIAYAYPVHGLEIDGAFSDWPASAEWYPLDRSADEHKPSPADASASFRVGYNLHEQALYVALKIVDDVHFPTPEKDAVWSSQDAHLLYIDRRHSPAGSGGVMYVYGGRPIEMVAPRKAWDPANAGADWDSVEVASVRGTTATTYEWKITLEADLFAHRTIGIDHLVFDRDTADEAGTILYWGSGLGKSTNPYRLGDVMLLPDHAPLGELSGMIDWAGNVAASLPRVIKISSDDHPALWTQAYVDENGQYSVTVPAGSYTISPAHSLTVPYPENADAPLRRIDDRATVSVTVARDDSTTAQTLRIPVFDRPDYLFQSGPALPAFDPEHTEELNAFIEATRQYYDVPGVSVALVKDGKRVYHQTFGVKNVVTGEPVVNTTLFEAASISKPMFAFAVMRMAEREEIDLDKPLHEYLPFPNIADDPRSKQLTARLVLSHQSGLPNWYWGGAGGWQTDQKVSLEFAPGDRFQYSGEAFDYLGRVVQEITGKSLQEVLQQEISEPMGLRNTFYAATDEENDSASIGHGHRYPVLRARPGQVSPASSVLTEAGDFSRFLVGLIEGKGLSPSSYRTMWSPVLEIPLEDRVYEDDGTQLLSLGWFLRKTNIGRLLEHGGNNGDFQCKFGLFPDQRMGYAIFTNNNVGSELARAIELFLIRGR